MIAECQVCKRKSKSVFLTCTTKQADKFSFKMIPFCSNEHRDEFEKHYFAALHHNKTEQFKEYYKILSYQYVD